MKRSNLDIKKILAEQKLKLNRAVEVSKAISGVQVRNGVDRENITGAIDYYDTITSNDTIPLTWTLEDNSEVVVTKAQLISIKEGYVLRKALIFNKYQIAKTALTLASTEEEVSNILTNAYI